MFIKKTLLVYTLFIFGLGFFASIPNVSYAQDGDEKCPYQCIDAAKCNIIGTRTLKSCCPGDTVRCVVDKNPITLNVPLPDAPSQINDIGDYINYLLVWLYRLGGVVAAMVIVWGGYTYITAAGNQARIGQAKEIITGGIIGLALLFGSVTLLGYINPNLINKGDDLEVDAIITQTSTFDLCTNQKADDLTVCGQPTVDSNGGSCISKKCSTGECLPALVGGGGVTKAGFACVDISDQSALADACEVSPSNACNIIGDKMSSNYCGPDSKGCEVGPKLICPPRGGVTGTQVSCGQCGISGNYDQSKKYKVVYKNTSHKHIEKLNTDQDKLYGVVCTDPPQKGVSYLTTISWWDDIYEVGAICCKNENSTDLFVGSVPSVD